MDQVSQIREKIDIVTLISDYITLKKAGKNFQALCPFHSEKTPSFVVSPDRSIWHCFGCGKGGDIYTFLMEYEKIEFPEALKILAKQAGITLNKTGFKDTTLSEKKERLLHANSIAADFYNYILTKHEAGKEALNYLMKRGLNDKLINTFKLGFAPLSGKSLIRYLMQKKKFSESDLIDAGLAVKGYSGISDFFRGRLMFPLADHRDNILGFSGRLLYEQQGFGGKYINTKETQIYQKRTQFYAANITLDVIRKKNQAILVEGEFDVISCFREGITNVLAIKGTALTDEQVNFLARFTDKITLCFDSDSAGQNALIRSLPILAKKTLNVTVVHSLDKDPDEAIKTNALEFKKKVEDDQNIYDYLFAKAAQENDLTSSEGKKKTADFLLPIIEALDNAIIKEHYLRKLSTIIDTTYESIITELEKKKKKIIEKSIARSTLTKRPRMVILEEYLLALIFQNNDPLTCAKIAWNLLSEFIPNNLAAEKLLAYFMDYISSSTNPDLSKFPASLPTELLDPYNTSLLFPVPVFSDSEKQFREVEKTAVQLRQIYLKEKIRILAEQINTLNSQNNEADMEKLKAEYSELVKKLKTQ